MRNDRQRMRDVWAGMLSRCYDPKNISYQYYGGKGVAVCERWRESFDTFLSDFGVLPVGMRIDRLDNAKGYQPDNVRMATVTEQNNNKSDTRLITFNGKTQNATVWAREVGLSPQTLHLRLKRGWSAEQALSIPRMKDGAHILPNLRKTGWRNGAKP